MTGLSTLQRVLAQELEHGAGRGRVRSRLDDPRREARRVQERAGLVAVVALVAHMERFRQQGAHVDAVPAEFQGLGQHRPHDLVHPAQLGQHLSAVRAIAQHLAVALVQVGEGQVAVGHIFHHIDHHGGRDDAGHGAYGVGDDGRVPSESPRWQRVVRRFQGHRRPAFVETGADDRAAQGPGSLRPGDGRAGVEQHPVVQAGITSRARATRRRIGRAAIMRSTAVRLAWSMSIMVGSFFCVQLCQQQSEHYGPKRNQFGQCALAFVGARSPKTIGFLEVALQRYAIIDRERSACNMLHVRTNRKATIWLSPNHAEGQARRQQLRRGGCR